MHSTSDTGLQSDPCRSMAPLWTAGLTGCLGNTGYRPSPADTWASAWGQPGGKRQQQPLLSKDVNLLEKKRGKWGGLGVRL